MREAWWAELAEVYGVARDDRNTWRPILGDLKRPKSSPIEHKIGTARVRRVIDDLLGADNWQMPADWGRALVTFPEAGDWEVPGQAGSGAGLWHWDSPAGWHLDTLNALFVVGFIGAVAPRGGGTLILSGSPRLLHRHEAALVPQEQRSDARTQRRSFYRSHPWLSALAGEAPSPVDRIAAFMEVDTNIDGIPARVVELTGEPGDMVFCHPSIVHCVSPNRGSEPRFMRIKQQILTHAGHMLLKAARHPR